MNYFNQLYNKGKIAIQHKTIIFCSIVRDCSSELKNNIPTIEQIGSYFADYRVVVVENNSIDSTKAVLCNWSRRNSKVHAIINDFDESQYSQIPKPDGYRTAMSLRRISKYVDYRNIYLEYIQNKLDFASDFVAIIDLDIAIIDIKGFITSFGNEMEWDAVTANGFSYSPLLKRRYHDTYPLFECGMELFKDSFEKIDKYRSLFEFLRKGMPFIRVASAYNGIAIFHYNTVCKYRYKILMNNYGGIEVLCEHVSLYRQMARDGYNKVFINPNMEVYYQRISIKLIIKKIKDIIKGYY